MKDIFLVNLWQDRYRSKALVKNIRKGRKRRHHHFGNDKPLKIPLIAAVNLGSIKKNVLEAHRPSIGNLGSSICQKRQVTCCLGDGVYLHVIRTWISCVEIRTHGEGTIDKPVIEGIRIRHSARTLGNTPISVFDDGVRTNPLEDCITRSDLKILLGARIHESDWPLNKNGLCNVDAPPLVGCPHLEVIQKKNRINNQVPNAI